MSFGKSRIGLERRELQKVTNTSGDKQKLHFINSLKNK